MLRLALSVAFFVVLCSFALSWHQGDPHWCQRGGALLAAIAAFMAIYDASIEHYFQQIETVKAGDRPPSLAEGTAVSQLTNKIRYAKFRERRDALSLEKRKSVFWISMIAIVGEVFHGFGDILYERLSELMAFLSRLTFVL